MRSDVDAFSILADAEAEKFETLNGKYADDFALLYVHGELELSFQIFLTGL